MSTLEERYKTLTEQENKLAKMFGENGKSIVSELRGFQMKHKLNQSQMKVLLEYFLNITNEIPLTVEGGINEQGVYEEFGYHEKLPIEMRIREIGRLTEGLTYMQWQTIEREVNHEYKRLANKNTLRIRDCMLKNILQDESFSTPAATEVEKITINLDSKEIASQIVKSTLSQS